jgi:hypothetical protein
MTKYTLSVIVAIKEWSESDIKRLLGSIACQGCSEKIQLIIIYSGQGFDELEDLFENFNLNIIYRYTPPNGVYNAYEIGVSIAEGDFIIFSGGDDFFMPALSTVLEDISPEIEFNPDVIAATVCFGDNKLLSPSKSKFAIVMKNWCQQGVLYKRTLFESFQFNPSYRIQADHCLNIQLMGSNNLRISFKDSIVAYFSCGGISQNQPDLNFWQDMPSIVYKNFGLIYALACYARRALGYLYHGHPNNRFRDN